MLSFSLSARLYLSFRVSIAHRYRHARILWEQINKKRTQNFAKSLSTRKRRKRKRKREKETRQLRRRRLSGTAAQQSSPFGELDSRSDVPGRPASSAISLSPPHTSLGQIRGHSYRIHSRLQKQHISFSLSHQHDQARARAIQFSKAQQTLSQSCKL